MSERRSETTLAAKGSTVRSTLTFVEARLGEGSGTRILETLPVGLRSELGAAGPTDEVPYGSLVALWQAVDEAMMPSTPNWADQSGAQAIESLGVRLYGGILRKSTPEAFLTQSVSLFRLYYHPGDMEVVEHAAERAVLRLVGFDPVTPLFCLRQTGGLRRAIEIAGGEGARVRHVRCTLEGDAFCEWELQWSLDGGKSDPG